jgi:hypothetical protein
MDYRTDVGYEREREAPANAKHRDEMKIVDDLVAYFREYSRERPQTVALVCFGIGFILGWKLKPW